MAASGLVHARFQVRLPLMVSFDLDCTPVARCVACGKRRPVPQSSEGFVAIDDSGTTVGTSDPCSCGSKRVRVSVAFLEDEDEEPEA